MVDVVFNKLRPSKSYHADLGRGVWLMDDHRWALLAWERHRAASGVDRFTLAHADYHWDGVFDAHENPAVAAQIANASLDELSALIARGKWIRYDSFIAPAVLRGRFDMVHFYCLQDDGDDVGIDAGLLAAGHAQQLLHQSAQSLAGLQAACPLIFDLCLDLFNRADGYFEGDLWSDEEVNAFLHTCRPLIETACLVTISLSFACSGTRSDTRKLAELVVPQILGWRA